MADGKATADDATPQAFANAGASTISSVLKFIDAALDPTVYSRNVIAQQKAKNAASAKHRASSKVNSKANTGAGWLVVLALLLLASRRR